MTIHEFQSHIVFEKIEQIKSVINGDIFREKNSVDNLIFFDTSIKYISDRLKLIIPPLVQDVDLTTISQEIENSLNQINSFLGNNNPGHISNAINNIYSAISRTRNLPFPLSKSDFNFSKEISIFENIIKEKHTLIEIDQKSTEQEILQLKQALASKSNELKKITDLLILKEKEIESISDKFTKEHEIIRDNLVKLNETEVKAFNTKFDETVLRYNKTITEKSESISNDTEKLVEEIRNKLTEARNIVGIIGNDSITGNYKINADANRLSANIFRGISILLMLILSVFVICAVWELNQDKIHWEVSLIRIIAATILFYPATYAARESSKHRSLEVINRKSELELTAINPFIELLPEEKKHEIKEKLVDKFFGNHDITEINKKHDFKDDEISVNGLQKILKLILPYMKNV